MRALIATLTIFGLFVVALPVYAQAAKGKDDGATVYDFDDDLVQGDLVRPDGENLVVRKRGARESLIKIREHFIPELLKSVENL
jgi:hypothetical protein